MKQTASNCPLGLSEGWQGDMLGCAWRQSLWQAAIPYQPNACTCPAREKLSEERLGGGAPETPPKQRSEFGSVGLPRGYTPKAPAPQLTALTGPSAQPAGSVWVGPKLDRDGEYVRPAEPSAPVRLGRTDMQKTAALRGVCAIGTSEWDSSSGTSVVDIGCTCCFGDGESCPPDASPKLHPWTAYNLKSMYDGSFTASGRRERILVMTGCESGAENFGSSYLVERNSQGSRVKRNISGFNPNACVVVPYIRRP